MPDWVEPVARYIWEVGVPGTLRLVAISVPAACVLGIVLGTLLTIRFWPSRALIRGYIEIWRGLPIIVTIFLLYLLLPAVDDDLPLVQDQLEFDPFTAAGVGLALWGSAQIAEATRGAVESIPREQHEAAAALGFGWVGRHAFVILPQSVRRLLPPLVSLLVNIIQNTTLAQVIGAADILETAERSNERLTAAPPAGIGEIHAIEIFGAVAVLFFVISFPLTRLAAYLERRMVA